MKPMSTRYDVFTVISCTSPSKGSLSYILEPVSSYGGVGNPYTGPYLAYQIVYRDPEVGTWRNTELRD